jgi:FimV-like protein
VRRVGSDVNVNQIQTAAELVEHDHYRRSPLWVAIFTALAFPTVVHAAQLGRLEVFSSAGQPLVAEIQVDRIAENERDGLAARMADREAFQAARLEPSALLSRLKIDLVPGLTPDKAIIRVTSSEPVPARFLDTLVELSWAGGKVVREYTLPLERLADPASSSKSDDNIKPPEIEQRVAEQRRKPRPVDQSDPEPKEDKPKAGQNKAGKSKTKASPPNIDTDSIGRVVKRGETLSSLVRSLYPDANSPEQAMAALYEANPEAFIGGSINLIRAGAKLRVPPKDALSQRTRKQARAFLAEHSVRAQSVMNRLATNPSKAQGNKESDSVSGKIGEGDAKNDLSKEDQLKVGRAKDADGKNDKANAAAEELLAKEKALKDANERIAMLEKSVNDLQKLVELKTKGADKPEEKPADAKASAPAEAAKADPQPEDKPAEAAQTNPPVPAAAEASALPTPKSEFDSLQPAAPVQRKEKGWVSWVLEHPLLLGGAGVLIGSIAAAVVIGLQRRKKKQEDALAAMKLAAMSPPVMKPVSGPVYAGVNTSVADDGDFPEEELEYEPPEVQPPPSAPSQTPAPTPSPEKDKLEFPPESQATGILGELDDMAEQVEKAKVEIIKIQGNAPEVVFEANPGDSSVKKDSEPEQPVQTPAPAPAVELEMPNPPIDEATWQELATKLDLAAAYVEIGDAEGARDLLTEVIKRGDVDQVKKAKELLASI